jgi:hypothetical protein
VCILLCPLWILEIHFAWKPFLHRLLELSPTCFVLSFRGQWIDRRACYSAKIVLSQNASYKDKFEREINKEREIGKDKYRKTKIKKEIQKEIEREIGRKSEKDREEEGER